METMQNIRTRMGERSSAAHGKDQLNGRTGLVGGSTMVIAAPPANEILATLREENLSVYRASPQRLREDVGQENQIAQDYRGRLIYELLQNADDAMATEDAGAARIRFVLTDDALWVGNSGR